MIKDLGYSFKQVRSFLLDIEEIKELSEKTYTFKEAFIEIDENIDTENYVFKNHPRTKMKLSGNKEDILEFEKIFLFNYMTMGG